VRVIGQQATAKEAPILILSTQSSFLDAFVAHWTGLPFLIVRSQDRQRPIFGRKYCTPPPSGPLIFVVYNLMDAGKSVGRLHMIHSIHTFDSRLITTE
jgi:hypothetical protein